MFFVFKYQLYLLQLEEYTLGRYWKLLFKKGYFYPNQPLRNQINWTLKAKLILAVAFLIYSLKLVFLWRLFGYYPAIAWLVLGLALFPPLYTIALVILWPLDSLIKKIIITRAKRIIKNNPAKIIGIAGSYGKTTMKNVLAAALSSKLKILASPENINTPLGIARWLIKNQGQKADILIVEMGEYYQGDIKKICNLTPPDIAVITGINEAHLERLKDIKTTVATIFEISHGLKPVGILALNADDQNILASYQKYTRGQNVIFYSSYNHPKANIKIENKLFNNEKLAWTFSCKEIGEAVVFILGEYIVGASTAAIWLGLSLGLNPQQVKQGLANIKPLPHRLQPMQNQAKMLIIDDSYNANPQSVKQGLEVLARFSNRRKIVLTPGLVEMGKKSAILHQDIGQQLAKVASQVILIKNSVTPYIAQGLKQAGFNEADIVWFNTAPEAHQALSAILKPGDVVLFQNDWPDQYT